MRVDAMIEKLKALEAKCGSDTEVIITDGWRCSYQGNYVIVPLRDNDKTYVIDIGIGGCEIDN